MVDYQESTKIEEEHYASELISIKESLLEHFMGKTCKALTKMRKNLAETKPDNKELYAIETGKKYREGVRPSCADQ